MSVERRQLRPAVSAVGLGLLLPTVYSGVAAVCSAVQWLRPCYACSLMWRKVLHRASLSWVEVFRSARQKVLQRARFDTCSVFLKILCIWFLLALRFLGVHHCPGLGYFTLLDKGCYAVLSWIAVRCSSRSFVLDSCFLSLRCTASETTWSSRFLWLHSRHVHHAAAKVSQQSAERSPRTRHNYSSHQKMDTL
ncbi:uncharacterized protein [Miscanthus floridulus]|uniref:uncharacterized protein isoform X5 n=1 Tax=Miscanthus floridulus TaxID=154761 RepID=UPI0034588037